MFEIKPTAIVERMWIFLKFYGNIMEFWFSKLIRYVQTFFCKVYEQFKRKWSFKSYLFNYIIGT